MAAIRVIAKGNQIDRKELGGALVIGRADECDLRVIDGDVSRRHCRIERRPEGYFVVDLGSRNGTLLDGVRVTRRALRDGDVLRVGNHTLEFESGAPKPRTLDDEVLEMLNDAAPSPGELELGELENAGDRLGEERPVQVAAAVVTQAPITAKPPTRKNTSLWEKATAAPVPSQIEKTTAKRAKERFSGLISLRTRPESSSRDNTSGNGTPWYRRPISLPAAIAAAVIVALGLYLWTSGASLTRSSSIAPQKVLPHSSPLNRD